MIDKANILLLSGYHAASHRYWCECLVANVPEVNWTQISLPDRHFYWRVRSNALSFAYQHSELQSRTFDLVIATSMVDLCNLRGLLPHLAQLPAILYFHENQFAYPQQKPNSNLINAQLTSVYSALVADKLVFNSAYNRDSFIAGATALFEKMPDGTPKGMLSNLASQSAVIPVPIADSAPVQTDPSVHKNPDSNKTPGSVDIVWNHRWEYDKQPEVFFQAMEKLRANGRRISLHVMGQSFRDVPECFTEFHQNHGDCVATWGFQSLAQYQACLHNADIVVSAALHDFQGLGMLEAIAAGCTPVAPNRMAYPEYIPDELLYAVSDDQATEAETLYQKLVSVIDKLPHPCIDTTRYQQQFVMPEYRDLIDGCMR